MERRLLAVGEQLWTEGDPATSMGVVEQGSVAIRSGGRVLGVMFERMVLGESAILGLDGPTVQRSATVDAIEDHTVVTEYPAAMVRDSFGVGVPRLVLRTLCGQICRNALLTMAAHPGQPGVEGSLMGLIQGVAACEKESRGIKQWDQFLVSFRLLYHLREGSDAMRDDLLPSRGDVPGIILRASEAARSIFKAADIPEYLEHFLDAERERQKLGT